jgi:hypothetical protein
VHSHVRASAAVLTNGCCELELELGLIQTHMTQKPVLRVEVSARCVARESKRKRGWLPILWWGHLFSYEFSAYVLRTGFVAE